MKKLHAGFTLLELLITTVLMSIISVVVGSMLLSFYNTFVISQNATDVDWQGLQVLETFTNDVHNIRSALDITTIGASSFTFTNMAGTSVTYQLSAGTLTRGGSTLATGVSSIAFSYLDKNGSTTATASAVRYISINTTIAQGNISMAFGTTVGTRGMSN